MQIGARISCHGRENYDKARRVEDIGDRVSVNVSIESFIASSVCRTIYLSPKSLTSIYVPDALFSRPRSPSDLLHRRDGRRQLHYFYSSLPLPPFLSLALHLCYNRVHSRFIYPSAMHLMAATSRQKASETSFNWTFRERIPLRSSINWPLYRHGFRRIFLSPLHPLIPFSINYFFEPSLYRFLLSTVIYPDKQKIESVRFYGLLGKGIAISSDAIYFISGTIILARAGARGGGRGGQRIILTLHWRHWNDIGNTEIVIWIYFWRK